MLWRPSCPPFCEHVTDMSEINFNMLKQFLDLENLCIATNILCLAHILKKILRNLSFGGHLGRHLEYINFPNDATVASLSFDVQTYWRTHLCKNILCGLLFGVAPKIFIGTRLQFNNSETLESDHVSFKIDNNWYNGFREKICEDV